MASYQNTSPTALADELVVVTSLSATSQDNVTGTAAGIIHLIEVDNTVNEEIGIYLKLVDASSATAGTTQPDFRLYIPPGLKLCYTFPNGHAYSNGVSLWATTNPEHTSKDHTGTSAPLRLVVTA